MTTEHDLRDAIDELAAEAADTELLAVVLQRHIARGRRQPPRSARARLTAVYAVAAVLAVIAGVTLISTLVARHSRTAAERSVAPSLNQPCATSATPSLTGIALAPIAGLNHDIVNVYTCAGYRTRSLYTPEGGLIGTVALYAPGVFERATLTNARTLTGHGITGFTGTLHTAHAQPGITCFVKVNSTGCVDLPGFIWPYTPGAWGVIEVNPIGANTILSTPRRSDGELTVAAAVRTGDTETLKSPFTIGDLAGLLPIGGSVSMIRPTNLGYADGAAQIELAVPGHGTHCPRRGACTAALTIDVNSTVSPPPAQSARSGRLIRLSDPGTTGQSGPASIYRYQVGHWSIIVTVTDPAAGVTNATVQRIVQSITLAPSTRDTSTWFRLDHAVPR